MTMIRRHRLTVQLALLRLTVRPALLPPLGRATMPWKRELRLQLRLRFRLRLMTMMSMIWRHSWIDWTIISYPVLGPGLRIRMQGGRS